MTQIVTFLGFVRIISITNTQTIMANHRVVLEIEVEANTPLEAAKEIQSWLDAADNQWQFYVQEEGSDKVFSVDLTEDESCAVLELQTKYQPLIK